ncbi:MAG TPA: AMP-binding protein [Micromonosporaceae bacterium]|nr:AMP-binding protein [Micromonosporaceae bacterium]
MQEPVGLASAHSDPPPDTLADRVRRAARQRPDHPALLWHDRSISWAELDARVDEVSSALLRSVPPDSRGRPARVAIALANSPDFAVAFFAVLRAGLVAVPINPTFTARELRHVLADSAAAVLICTEAVRAELAAVRDQLPDLGQVHVALPTAAPAALATAAAGEPSAASGPSADGGPPVVRADDLAVLLYTSGTEGEPKGAMLSHRALAANHEQVASIMPPVLGPDDVILLSLPLFHAYGLNSGLGAVAYHGATGVLVERFDPADALGIIARHHITALIGVPSMFVGWALLTDGGWSVGEAMTSVRVAVCGAAPLNPASAGRFTEATRHPVFVGYGLTETAPVLTSTLASPLPKAGSIGRPIPGVELRLVAPDGTVVWHNGQIDAADEDDFDLDLPAAGADPGEIVVRGANLFSGYWPDGRGGPDADGWWATGDIAYADVDGDLFLVDRLGELILVSGFNVYPHEVELVLSSHPGVAEAAVVGLPHPYTGQTVKAYVVRASGSRVTAEEVLGHCERNLARFKCPTAVEFVDRLPHSPTGKVRKTLLRPEGHDG